MNSFFILRVSLLLVVAFLAISIVFSFISKNPLLAQEEENISTEQKDAPAQEEEIPEQEEAVNQEEVAPQEVEKKNKTEIEQEASESKADQGSDEQKDKDKDKTPPVITELGVESITMDSAVIMWTTDEPADSDIKYGITPHTNINGPRDDTLVLSHAISLSELQAGTSYDYCVTSRDEANNKTNACGVFTTDLPPPPDVTPPVISGLRAESVTDNSAVILWTTDEPADSRVTYGLAPASDAYSVDDPSLTLSHSISLSGLATATAYAYCVISSDVSGNEATMCEIFTTASIPPPPDVTPPVVTELRAESITTNSATILWTTDELADSAIMYGIAPATDTIGPENTSFTLTHELILLDLAVETNYAYCITTRDMSNNATEECGMFMTAEGGTPPPPPPPSPSSGGGGGRKITEPSSLSVSGFAYPDAKIFVSLRALPFGDTLESETIAGEDGSFSASFNSFPKGLYMFSVNAIDKNGLASARKGFQFDVGKTDAQIFKNKVLIPPTLKLARDKISWGDNILVSGMAVPETGVLVEIGNVSYEAKSDNSGAYEILINTARVRPGKVPIRVRSAMISEFGYDYSLSKIITLSVTTVPQADLNADGVVDIIDLSKFLFRPTDMNGDNLVNSADTGIFLRAFGNINR